MGTPSQGRHAFVVAAYGDSPMLGTCIESIAGQSRTGSDVLITTSTPSDYLRRIAAKYRLPLVINPSRGNIGSDWNFALAAADAAYVTIAHQDDAYQPDYLQRMMDAVAGVQDLAIAFSDFVETSPAGPRPVHLNLRIKRFLTQRAFGRRDVIRDQASKLRMLAWGNPVCCPSVLFNRARLGEFRFSEALSSNLDWEAWRQLASRAGAFVYIRAPLVTRHIHARSETSALIADNRRLEEDRVMFERFWPAPVAAMITRIYRASYRANRV